MKSEDAGHPFLAFLNTVGDDGKTRHINSIDDGDALLAVLRAAGFDCDALDAPGRGQLATILTLRESCFAVFSALASGRRPGREDALFLETGIQTALQDAEFRFAPAGMSLRPGPLGGLQDALLLSAFDLLQSDDLCRLRECRRCTRLFLDHGRGRGRQWCAMARCGNRAKVEAFRARHRPETG